jgi:hypothetical protein
MNNMASDDDSEHLIQQSSQQTNILTSSTTTSTTTQTAASAATAGVKMESDHFTQDLKKYINLGNTKFIALLLIAFFIFYHGYLNSFYGNSNNNNQPR